MEPKPKPKPRPVPPPRRPATVAIISSEASSGANLENPSVKLEFLPDWPHPLPFIETVDGKLAINSDTASRLEKILDPVVVVSVVGPPAVGKSFLLNRLIHQHKGFQTANTVDPATKGIWIWVVPHLKRSDCRLVLLDTEGLGSVRMGDSRHDIKIFALATLLSSTLILNSIGTIDSRAIEDIHCVTQIAEQIQVLKQPDDENAEMFRSCFPSFVWAVRDCTLELTVNDKPTDDDGYLEHSLEETNSCEEKTCIKKYFPDRKCFVFPLPETDSNELEQLNLLDDSQIEPRFVRKLDEFRDWVLNSSDVRTVFGNMENGLSLSQLGQCYVEAMRSDKNPCIQSAIEEIAKNVNEKAIAATLALYKEMFLKAINFPADTKKLSTCHNKCEDEACKHFLKVAVYDSKGDYYKNLMEKLQLTYQDFTKRNDDASVLACQEILKGLEQRFLCKDYITIGGPESYKEDMISLVVEYEKVPRKGLKATSEMVSFIQQREPIYQQIIEAEKKLTISAKKYQELLEKTKKEELQRQVLEAQNEQLVKYSECLEASFGQHKSRIDAKEKETKRIVGNKKTMKMKIHEKLVSFWAMPLGWMLGSENKEKFLALAFPQSTQKPSALSITWAKK